MFSAPPSRQINYTELDDPKPLCVEDTDVVGPSVYEIAKLVPAVPATIALIRDSVDVVAVTSTVETMALFPI